MTFRQVRCTITGANGFIGLALVPHLSALGYSVEKWPRNDTFDLANNVAAPNKWITQLSGIDTVVHLAGLAHQSRTSKNDSHFFSINRDGTLRLATAASAAGVKRFIFISTAKVFGEGGSIVYNATTIPAPADAYAQSKWQAEQLLIEQFSPTMELVILRPPLVYGWEAKANFANLLKLSLLPIPLPFAGIKNRRAMIGIDNLIDLIATCITSPAAAGKTFLCADAQHYSLADMVLAIRSTIGRNPWLFQPPLPLLHGLKKLLGRATSERLLGDFQMDCTETYKTLDWKPPFTIEQILSRGARSTW